MNKLVFAGIGIVLVACGEVKVAGLDPTEFSGSGGDTCTAESAAFSTKVVPIFSSKSCTNSGCHGGGSSSGNLALDGATATVFAAATGGTNRVNTSSPDSSKMLRKPLGLDNHGGQKLFSSTSDSDYKILRCWISSGAQNN